MLHNLYAGIPPEILRNGLPKSFFLGRDVPPDSSREFESWVNFEIDKCLHGWSDGGVTCTGDFYFYLNHFVLRVQNPKNIKLDTVRRPDFCWVDKEIYDECALAEKYDEDFMIITGRGQGKSKMMLAKLCNTFNLLPNSEVIIAASLEDLSATIWGDLETYLNWSKEGPMYVNLLIDTKKHKKSGYTTQIKDRMGRIQNVDKGLQSEIIRVTFGNNAGATRGKRPNYILWEEVGAWKGSAPLSKCRRESLGGGMVGTSKKLTNIYIGTGGQMDSGGSLDARRMAFNPGAYNLRSYIDKSYYPEINKWGKGRKTCFFVSCFQKVHGHYQEYNGYNQDEESLEKFRTIRALLKENNAALVAETGEEENYDQHIQEFPFNLEEAFLTNTSNTLGVEARKILESRIEELEILQKNKDYPYLPVRGVFVMKKDSEGNQFVDFVEDSTGPVVMYEKAVKNEKGQVYPNLYSGGIDSFDSTSGESLGSTYFYKRYLAGQKLVNTFVCNISYRPKDPTQYYTQTVLGVLYYKAKTLLEYTRIAIISEFKNWNALHWLVKKPEFSELGKVNKTKSTNIGTVMTRPIKETLIKNFIGYILTTSLTEMQDKELCLDLNMFTYETNHDRVMAAGLAYSNALEMSAVELHEVKKDKFKTPHYRKDSSGRVIFAYDVKEETLKDRVEDPLAFLKNRQR